MTQIILSHSGGTVLTLEIVRNTLQQQDNAVDTAESFFPRLRRGLGQTGSCSVFLPLDKQPEIAAKLLTLVWERGAGKLQISGDKIIPVFDALLNITLTADPPQAKLSWQGTREV